MNFPSTTRNFQQQPQIHINPHMIQNNNQHQPLPIITRPISNSPVHFVQPNSSQNKDLRHSHSTYQMQPIHQSR